MRRRKVFHHLGKNGGKRKRSVGNCFRRFPIPPGDEHIGTPARRFTRMPGAVQPEAVERRRLREPQVRACERPLPALYGEGGQIFVSAFKRILPIFGDALLVEKAGAQPANIGGAPIQGKFQDPVLWKRIDGRLRQEVPEFGKRLVRPWAFPAPAIDQRRRFEHGVPALDAQLRRRFPRRDGLLLRPDHKGVRTPVPVRPFALHIEPVRERFRPPADIPIQDLRAAFQQGDLHFLGSGVPSGGNVPPKPGKLPRFVQGVILYQNVLRLFPGKGDGNLCAGRRCGNPDPLLDRAREHGA